MFQFTLHLGLESLVPTVLYIAMIVVFFMSAAGRPRIGLYFLIPLLPLQTVRYRLHDYALGSLLVDFILLGVFIGLRGDGWQRMREAGMGKLLIGYAIFTYIGLWKGAFYLESDLPLWFGDPRLQDWKNYMVMPFLYFAVTAAFENTKQIKLLLLLMCLSTVMLDKYYMGTVSSRDFSQFSYDSRYAGAMGYAGVNGFAAFEAQMSTFLLGLATFEKRRHVKLGYYVLVAFNAYCLLFSLSRGGYLAIILGCLFVGVLRNRILLLLAIMFLLSWQTLVPAAVRERVFMTHGEHGEIDASAGDRLSLWDDALTLFKSDPVFGAGYNTYAYLRRLGYGDTHNYYLKVLVETGVTGLCLFLWILWRMIGSGWRLWREADNELLRGIGFGFVGFMLCAAISNFFGDRWTFLQVSGYTWSLLGLMSAGLRIVETGEEESDQENTDELEVAYT